MGRIAGRVARLSVGMTFFVVVTGLMVGAAVIGALVDAVVPAVLIAVLFGCAGTWLLSAVVGAHARALAHRIDSARDDADARRAFGGHREWRELADAVDGVVASLHAQSGRLVAERVRSKRLLEDLPSAVLLLDDDRIVYTNRAAREMFAIADDQDDVPATDILDETLAKTLLDAVEETHEVGRPIDVELERDAAILAARAATLGAGEAVLVVRDVTRSRRLAVVRRDFVINASHELKTPVAGIQALAESLALALRHDPGRATRMVARIEQEAARLARLVRDLLDLARLEEQDDDQGDQRPVDLVQVVEAQLDRLHSVAAEHRISMTTDMPDRTIIAAAPEDVRSIVANLLENAVRYNVEGGAVEVRLRRTDGHVTLEVHDTGEGIAPQERQRIFERFYRIDKARSRAAGGTGLGLSLVRHATERLGGTVTVDSELGVGSTFRVDLPVTGD
ncbi:MAG TPA: HAMP domain-containing sensor histidine kinase [Euzebyales bacterium]|nr:HAMP domain-containing sensor histidine kinase [Euzebyales bacterium]